MWQRTLTRSEPSHRIRDDTGPYHAGSGFSFPRFVISSYCNAILKELYIELWYAREELSIAIEKCSRSSDLWVYEKTLSKISFPPSLLHEYLAPLFGTFFLSIQSMGALSLRSIFSIRKHCRFWYHLPFSFPIKFASSSSISRANSPVLRSVHPRFPGWTYPGKILFATRIWLGGSGKSAYDTGKGRMKRDDILFVMLNRSYITDGLRLSEHHKFASWHASRVPSFFHATRLNMAKETDKSMDKGITRLMSSWRTGLSRESTLPPEFR